MPVTSCNTTQSICYAKNVAAATANTNVVAVTFSLPAVYADIRVLEYSGTDLANPVDATAGACKPWDLK